MSLKLGEFGLDIFSGGRFHMDGGAMFGVVPRTLWSRKAAADEQNRIALATQCLLIRTPDARVLVDTGYGPNLSPRERANYAAADAGHPLLTNLETAGIDPDSITHVILTHLHFDHAGGCTVAGADGRLRPAFPRARHVVQRAEWEDAAAGRPELRGSYFERDFLPLQGAGLVDLVEGNASILPGIQVHLACGHTRGHQLVRIASGGQTALFVSDLCPTTAHLKMFWTMGYDQFPLEVRRSKPVWLGRASDEGWLVLFYHDVNVSAVRLRRDEREEFVIDRVVLP